MNYISVQEYAEIKGVSRQAVLKSITKGKLSYKEVPHPNITGKMSFMILHDNQSMTTHDNQPMTTHDNHGEHDNQVAMTTIPENMPVSMTTHDNHFPDVSNMVSESIPPEDHFADPGNPILESTSSPHHLVTSSPEEYVPYHRTPEAQLFAMLMDAIEQRIDAAPAKSAEWQQITSDYNSRSLVPELYKLKGQRSERALRLWYQKWSASGNDMFCSIHGNVNHTRGRKVTELEKNYLLSKLLHDSKPSVSSAIQDMKSAAELGIIESPSSFPTLKRWVNDWATSNPAQWAQARQGSKFVKDNIVKSIMRDTSMLEVGDVLVADGHELANSIINPITGKPTRMTLIMFYDWASRYPLGASLVMTESSQHILTAVRNAIMQLGFMPRYIYFDNGRAFKSKIFHAKWEEHDLQMEFAGIFPRLGIKAQFAESYNARTKVIERFFRTMQEQFERFQSAFRGRNIDDKPAQLARNEKWAQKMFTGKPMEYSEALDLAYYYFRHIYGMRAHAGIQNKKPYEVFASRVIDPARVIQPERLNFLLLKSERKHLRSEGIWLNNCKYYDEEMVNHIGSPVIIRYDYSDLRSILVYDMRGEFICHANLREAKHGFVFLSDNPLAHQELIAEIRENKRLRKNIEKSTAQLIKNTNAIVEAELKKHSHITQGIMEDIKESNPTFRQPPMLPPSAKKQDIASTIADLERTARAQDAMSHADAMPPTPEIPIPSVIPAHFGEPPAKAGAGIQPHDDDTLAEMPYNEVLKRIGIER